MKDFHQWLETNHPELNEGLLKNAALAGAMALGAVNPNIAQADQPTTSQDQMQQLRDRQEQRRNRFKLPIMMTLAGAAAAARAAKRKSP